MLVVLRRVEMKRGGEVHSGEEEEEGREDGEEVMVEVRVE